MGDVQINFVEDFPEGKEILERNLCAVDAEMKKFEKYIKELYSNKEYPIELKVFMKAYIKVFYFDRLIKSYKRLKRELAMYTGSDQRLNVELAKSVPIQDLYDFERVHAGRQRITAKCPFHDEKIPSFVIYKHNNSFHCFSCLTGGDNITFVMKLKDMDFVDATKYLLNMRQ